MKFCFTLFIALFLVTIASAENCGRQVGGAVCPNGECCSRFGWCGVTDDHCTNDCQSQCRPATPTQSGGGVAAIIPQSLFDSLLKYRNDARCAGNGFYTYNAFITAAQSFPGFGTSGDANTQRKEVAAFLAQTSHETTGQIDFLLIQHLDTDVVYIIKIWSF